ETMSFANLISDWPGAAPELSDLLDEYEQRFGPSIIFEHGSSGRSPAACGVSRAHIHLIPAKNFRIYEIESALTLELGEPKEILFGSLPTMLSNAEYLLVGRRENKF